MKKRNLFLTLGLALGLGVGVAAGLGARVEEAKEVEAGTVKDVWVEIGNNCDWTTGKIAIGFWGAGDHFSNLVSINSSDKFYKLTYTADAGDTGCNVILYGTGKATADWSDIVSQTKNMTIGNEYTVWDKDGEDSKYWFTVDYRATDKNASLTGDLDVEFDCFSRGGEGDLESVKAGISVTAGQKFKVSYDGNEYALLNDYVATTSFDTTTNTGYITAKATGNYDMYFNKTNHKLWVEENADVAATAFATTFLSTTGAICKDSSLGAGDTDLAALAAKWNAKAEPDGTSLVEQWNALTPAAKSSFNAGTANETLTNAKARYLVIIGRYSATLTAFAGGPSSAYYVPTAAESHNVTPIVIVLATTIGLIAVASFFVIRRRKENN